MILKLMRVVVGMAAFASVAAIAGQEGGAAAGAHGNAAKRYAVIRDQAFRVVDADGSLSAARYVLDKRDGSMMSCFTRPPAFVTAAAPVVTHLKGREGRFACFEGRGALEELALQKRLIRSPSAAPAAKVLTDEDDEDWGQEDQGMLEGEFWGGYAEQVAADTASPLADPQSTPGSRCMSECNAALGAALRFCRVIPPPASTFCTLGAGGLYVICIASC